MHRLDGRYHMTVTASEICLKRPGAADDGDDDDKEEACIFWPLKHITKLKSEPQADGRGDLITLVASRSVTENQLTNYLKLRLVLCPKLYHIGLFALQS